MTDDTPVQDTTTPTVPVPAAQTPIIPGPVNARLNVQIPIDLDRRLKSECDARMIGAGLLVARALESFLDNLPELP